MKHMHKRMRIAVLAIFAFTMSVSGIMSVHTPATAAALADGLVAYWNYDEGAGTTAADVVNGYDATLMNGASWVPTTQVVGGLNAGWFDGINDVAEVVDTTDLDLTGSFSVSGWVSTLNPSTQILVRKTYAYELFVHNGHLAALLGNGSIWSGTDILEGSINIDTGAWTHVAMTYDDASDTLKLYVNGVPDAMSASYLVSVGANSYNMTMGGWNDGTGSGFHLDGLLDEVRLYNRVLTDNEVARLFDYYFTVELTPDTDSNPVGDSHTATLTLTPALSHIPVLIQVNGAHGISTGANPPGDPYLYTDENGQASLTYTGTNAGMDYIIGCIDLSDTYIGGGLCNYPSGAEPYDEATKEWTDTHIVSGTKYQDTNANGSMDGGDFGLENWFIFLDDGNGVYDLGEEFTMTDANGYYEFHVYDGQYSVCEYIPALWVQTQPGLPLTPSCHPITVSGADEPGNDFGNVHLVPTTGKTLGFWTNRNGFAAMNDGNTVAPELLWLSLYNLVDKNGDPFDPGTYQELRQWLLKSTGQNMAYKVSAHMASAILAVEAGLLDHSTLIYAPELLPYAPITGLNAGGFISVEDLIVAANNELLAHPTAATGDAWWAYQNALRIVLDAVNSQLSIAVET